MYLLSFPQFSIVGNSWSWPWIVAAVTFPICAAKQWINVVQMVKAAGSLAEGDLELRSQAKKRN